jgi:quercetin dioxygenase-like cupin family protein
MSALAALPTLAPFDIWGEAVRARKIEGDHMTLAVIELAPGAVVPAHHHPQEQIGICIVGTVRFTVGDETRDLGPGGMWCARPNVSHGVTAGPDGAVVVEAFSPIRSDWAFPPLEPRPPVWPPEG